MQLSLNSKICVAATALAIFSLGITAAVIGFKSSANAEAASMALARTAAREVSSTLQARISSNLSAVTSLAGAMRGTRGASLALQREQINELSKATLASSEDLIGVTVTWEPNALDGKDAEFAGQAPLYDASGRYMPYWTRGAGGKMQAEPIVFDPKPGANDWYDVPKRSGKPVFTEPYLYPVDGKSVLMASLVAPIMIDGFKGAASADFMLTRLTTILAGLKVIEGGQLALISNGGLYASHPLAARLGKPADDVPAAGLDNVAIVSDYRFRGLSQSRKDPALQGGIDYTNNPTGFYAGTWLSTIDWTKDAGGDGHIEWDLYAGKRGEIAKDFTYDVGGLYYYYPSNGLSPNANTFELYGQLGYGPVYAKYSYSLTNLFGFADRRTAATWTACSITTSTTATCSTCTPATRMSRTMAKPATATTRSV